MKTSGVILVIFLFLFFVSALSADEQGKEIFKSKGCIFCHKMGRSSGTIPSLPDLAKAYKGGSPSDCQPGKVRHNEKTD